MVADMDLIGVALLLFVAAVALVVIFFDALGRVLVGAVAAIARAPWPGGQLIRSRVRDQASASRRHWRTTAGRAECAEVQAGHRAP